MQIKPKNAPKGKNSAPCKFFNSLKIFRIKGLYSLETLMFANTVFFKNITIFCFVNTFFIKSLYFLIYHKKTEILPWSTRKMPMNHALSVKYVPRHSSSRTYRCNSCTKNFTTESSWRCHNQRVHVNDTV